MSDFKNTIFAQIISDLFDRPVMSNIARPHYVERLVAVGLGEGWKLVSADWAGWDIENFDGIRIEVKQSASRQTWTDRPSLDGRPTKGSFDIAARTGYFSEGGSKWNQHVGRPADIYIFAWHPIFDRDACDQRDPGQWKFFVVPETGLPPNQKSIGASVLAEKWEAVDFSGLGQAATAEITKLSEIKSAFESC